MKTAPALAAMVVFGAVVVLGVTTPALAATPESAQTLFDRGLEAFNAGRYDAACPALEQSYQLDPLPGVLFTLAECEAKRRRFAAAASRYDEYLRVYAALAPEKQKQSKQVERERIARAQRAAIALKVAELTLVLSPGAPPETKVTRDGTPLPAAALGVPGIVDPGEHVITVQVPGGPPSETRISLAPGEKKGVALEARKVEAAGSLPTLGAAPGQQDGGPSTTVFIAGGAVAGVGVVLGAVLLGLSASEGSTAKSDNAKVGTAGCPAGGRGATGICASVVSALDSKSTFINAGVWSLVGAGVVGVGTLIYGVAGSSRALRSGLVVAPVVTAQGGGLFVKGSF